MTQLTLLALLSTAAAQDTAEPADIRLRLTVLDAPFHFDGGSTPSMDQSLDVAYDLNRLATYRIQQGFEKLFPHDADHLGLGTTATWLAAIPLSLVSGWMHEEWHRAVMARHGISSRNGVFYLEAWSNGTISVDHVTDEDLSRLKADSPADTVRLMSAGMESQHALAERVGDEAFFHGGSVESDGPLYRAETWMAPVIVMNEVNSLFYHYMCAGEESDTLTDSENQRGTNPEVRDFTGLDCVAWVYDLSRPDEPHADRGSHPYGEGVDRYRSWEDLSADEQALLTRVTWLHLLNFLNPHMYGINGFVLPGEDNRWVAQVGAVATPFGYTLGGRFALKRGEQAMRFGLHNHFSELGWSPGVEAAVLEHPVGSRLSLDAGVALWLQPRDLRWDAEARKPGGQVKGELAWRATESLDLWLSTAAKTEGWVLGEVYLDPNVSGRMGLTAHIR